MPESRPFIPLNYTRPDEADVVRRARDLYATMSTRRSVRHFATDDVPRAVIEDVIRTASTAPSGAHKQPWTFVAVHDPALKRRIREAAEQEEHANYTERMSETWLDDLEPFATDWHKPMLTDAPWLIVVFRRLFEYEPDGTKHKNYYVNESVGLATGFLLSAIHQAGLVSLTHTPSPMGFLAEVLDRPDNERAFLLIPVGYPAPDCEVPVLERKTLDEVAVFHMGEDDD